MQIQNIAGYKFLSLSDINTLRTALFNECHTHALKGTILLSTEGININLAGTRPHIAAFKASLKKDQRFSDIRFHDTYSKQLPFQRLKIKIKKEIITLRQPEINAQNERASSISPHTFKKWLDEKQDIILLDTRNDYEIRFGTFAGAVNLDLSDFNQLPAALEEKNSSLKKDKTIVMFCTGGIRCEKAALYMMSQGFSNVYQLDGGILGYFAQVGGTHYQGECFVFDERIAVDPHLNARGTT